MFDQGTRKSAILLMTLGEEAAGKVLQQMSPSEVQALGEAMATLAHVKRNEVNDVLEEFRFETEQYSALHLDSGSYLRAVLNKAMGNDRAADLLEGILQSNESVSGIERLNQLEATEVVELIRDEHPQIIATLLVHMERNKAADVLELLPERARHDAVLRVATFGGVQPAALKELTEVLTRTTEGRGLLARKCLDEAGLSRMQELVREVPVAVHVKDYAVRLVLGTPQSCSSIRQRSGCQCVLQSWCLHSNLNLNFEWY